MKNSRRGRFLAVILAGILAFNCNTATVSADDTPQDPAAEVQIQEEPQNTDSASEQDETSHAEEKQDIPSAEDSLPKEKDDAADSSDSDVHEPEAEDNEKTIQEDSQESSDSDDSKKSESVSSIEEPETAKDENEPAVKPGGEKRAALRKASFRAGNYNINGLVSKAVSDPAPDAADPVTGNKVVHPDKEYSMFLTFEESGAGRQFPDGNMTYTIPSGFTPNAKAGSFDLPLTGLKIEGNRFTVNPDGTVDITWNIPFDDPENERTKAWASAADAGFKIEFSGTFTSEPGKFDFGGSGNVYQNYETGRYSLKKNAKTRIGVSRVDIANGEELEGATIQILDKDGNVVDVWVSANEAHKIQGLTTGEEYTLKETAAPDGYTVTAETTFKINKDGTVTTAGSTATDAEGNTILLVEGARTKVRISSTDIADGEVLEGAHIQILDMDGNRVEEWNSEKAAHVVEGLKTGEVYTLTQTVAPDGYTVTTDTTFTIDETGKVTSTGSISEEGVLLVEDAKTGISVSKVDISTGEEVEGAMIQVVETDKEGNEKVAKSWRSGRRAHKIEGLKTGVEYILREKVAPEGYTVATDTTFTINKTGIVTYTGNISVDGVLLIEDSKTRISVSKVDIADGEELEGAHIQIIFKESVFGKETIIEEWDSTKDAHVVEGLKIGVEYILRETAAPEGYTAAADIKFSLDENGEVTSTGTVSEDGVLLVEDAKKGISVSKVDIADGEELEGAHIQILDQDGNIFEEWDSEKAAHVVEGLKTGEVYTLKETVAPDGYIVTTDTTFTIDETGKVTSTGSISEEGVLLVEDEKTKISVSKVDIADGKELEGAKIQIIETDEEGNEKVAESWTCDKEAHEIEGLKTGVLYILREKVAPEGYTVTTDTTFTIDETGKVTSTGSISEDGVLLVEDEKTKISVSKVDITDGGKLEGAHIQILKEDLSGKETIVEEWDSTKRVHRIKGLKTGVEYILRETVAPEGYTITPDTTFMIDETGKVTSTGTVSVDGVLLVEDSKTRISVSKVDIADGEELEGAHIQILDKDGNIVEEWDSQKAAHVVEGLKIGEEYTLKETAAPDGYTVTTDTTFTIDETGKVTSTGSISEEGVLLVEDEKTKISVSKVDIADGEEVEGAHIQILDKDGNIVEEWDSTKAAHVVEGLKTGEEYTLKETAAPDGYTVTDGTTFTIDETGKVTSTGTVSVDGVLLVENAKTRVSVSKVDTASGEKLEGAHIQILDKDGKIVEEWDSKKEAHVIEGLKTGVEYTLHETAAPNGYETAADITFMIDKYGIVTTTGKMSEDGTILIKNAKKTVKKDDKKRKGSSKTGDDANAMLWLMLAIGASGSMICVTRKRKRA
ncbi:MAG: hypothetical protein II628_10710 [Lachnospiraceae bacterium]|nr:hypothetical protein [Lachnospiraceae bacterium]